MTLPWPISTEYPEDCRYNTLLQISIGQVQHVILPCTFSSDISSLQPSTAII